MSLSTDDNVHSSIRSNEMRYARRLRGRSLETKCLEIWSAFELRVPISNSAAFFYSLSTTKDKLLSWRREDPTANNFYLF